jgi:DNA polymerase-3 subunit gamma/tau
LVAFCGNTITEANVQDVFGFTSSETVAGLAAAIIDRDTSQAFARVQGEFEKGKDLSQLLAELTGFLRSLLIARLTPDASNEGIPEALWTELTTKAAPITEDRLLAVLDRLADADAKMRRASNKQLHFEIALIRAIQSLDEVKISDVIKALERAPSTPPPADPSSPPPAATAPAGGSPPRKKQQPAPRGRKQTRPDNPTDALSSHIENAPEARPDDPEPVPESTSLPPAETSVEAPAAPEAAAPDSFHDDPLVKEAVRLFKGKLKT